MVGVAIKPPDESLCRLETARTRAVPLPVPARTVHDPDPRRRVTDGRSKQAR